MVYISAGSQSLYQRTYEFFVLIWGQAVCKRYEPCILEFNCWNFFWFAGNYLFHHKYYLTNLKVDLETRINSILMLNFNFNFHFFFQKLWVNLIKTYWVLYTKSILLFNCLAILFLSKRKEIEYSWWKMWYLKMCDVMFREDSLMHAILKLFQSTSILKTLVISLKEWSFNIPNHPSKK